MERPDGMTPAEEQRILALVRKHWSRDVSVDLIMGEKQFRERFDLTSSVCQELGRDMGDKVRVVLGKLARGALKFPDGEHEVSS